MKFNELIFPLAFISTALAVYLTHDIVTIVYVGLIWIFISLSVIISLLQSIKENTK